MKHVLLAALAGTAVPCAASAQPITCPPPPSTSDVKQSVDVGTEANLLSRFLSKFRLNYEAKSAIQQKWSQLPNADQIFKQLNFMSLKCTIIMAKNESNEEKIREWDAFIDQMAGYVPPDQNTYSPPPQQAKPNYNALPGPSPSLPITKAEIGTLAVEWTRSVLDASIDLDRALTMSSFPFCASRILQTQNDFQSAFSDRNIFGPLSDLYASNVDTVGSYLYATQQRLATVQGYEMRDRGISLLVNQVNVVRNCRKWNVISDTDYVVEVHVSLPAKGQELFAYVVASKQDGTIKGFLD